ncbi:MAG: replicative DNA helicase [Alphaproteobacteria bacterium]
MATVTTLVQPNPAAALPTVAVPHSVEAEQALLGAIMYNNKALDDLGGRLLADHFYVPFHAELFAVMERLINKGFEANPRTLFENLKRTPFAQEADLSNHLVHMLESAVYTNEILSLAEIIHTHYLQRQMMALGGEMARNASQAHDNTAAQEVLEKTSSELFALAETGNASTTVQDLKKPLQIVIQRAEEARSKDGPVGLPTGFKDIDDKLGGLQNSDLIILAARPSMGKTAFAGNLTYNIARACQMQRGGKPVGFFSLEMSADQLASRLLCSAAGVDSIKLQRGDMHDSEFGRVVAASNELAECPIYIDDTPGLSVTALRARARRMKRQFDIGLLVVDYLQLLRAGSGKNQDNRVQEISEISMTLKAIARELNVPVIALSQLSRAVENRDNKRPQLSDLRESGSIEQDADIVMFLYREEYYIEKQLGLVEVNEAGQEVTETGGAEGDKSMTKLRERLEQVRGKVEVLISKNRKGATGVVALTFQPEITTFHNYSPRH